MFPDGRWQVLHAIRAEMPGGRALVMMGLTLMSARDRTHRSVLLTLEGFVVFDARVRRPADRAPGAAAVRLAALRGGPHGGHPARLLRAGRPGGRERHAEDGGAVRRHRLPDGGTVDLELLPGGDWRIRRYDPSETLTRTVRARHGRGDQHGFPEAVELTAAGGQDYRLTMTLIEAVPAR